MEKNLILNNLVKEWVNTKEQYKYNQYTKQNVRHMTLFKAVEIFYEKIEWRGLSNIEAQLMQDSGLPFAGMYFFRQILLCSHVVKVLINTRQIYSRILIQAWLTKEMRLF